MLSPPQLPISRFMSPSDARTPPRRVPEGLLTGSDDPVFARHDSHACPHDDAGGVKWISASRMSPGKDSGSGGKGDEARTARFKASSNGRLPDDVVN